MEITELIKVFEKLIPVYEKAVEDNLNADECKLLNIHHGICNAALIICNNSRVYSIFDEDEGHYKNFLVKKLNGYIAPTLFNTTGVKKCLQPRIDFMKEQIVELNNLLKQGYTDV